MTITIIILSTACALLFFLCLFLMLYLHLTNKMLQSKDLMIMELQKRISLEIESGVWAKAAKILTDLDSEIRKKGAMPGK